MNSIALKIFNFWFNESKPNQWFIRNNEYDKLIKTKFKNIHEKAVKGQLDEWKNTPQECLSLILIIDQFSRNIYRNHENSFKYDSISLNLCKYGLNNSYLDNYENDNQKLFYILPLIHSEKIENQSLAIELASNELINHSDFNKIKKFFDRHKEIIEKFNRFPHRNIILNRKSTKEEIAFLKTPLSSF